MALSFSTIANATLKCSAQNEVGNSHLYNYTAHHGSYFSTSILKDVEDKSVHIAKDGCSQDSYILSVFDDSVGNYLKRRYHEIRRLTNYSYYMNDIDQNHLPLIYAMAPKGYEDFLTYKKGLGRPKIYDIRDGGKAFLRLGDSSKVRQEAALSLAKLDRQKANISGYALYYDESRPGSFGTALIHGQAIINGNVGVFSNNGCYFKFNVNGNDIKVTSDNGKCGGKNISFNGEYRSSPRNL